LTTRPIARKANQGERSIEPVNVLMPQPLPIAKEKGGIAQETDRVPRPTREKSRSLYTPWEDSDSAQDSSQGWVAK
jgi:hypothetical protein